MVFKMSMESMTDREFYMKIYGNLVMGRLPPRAVTLLLRGKKKEKASKIQTQMGKRKHVTGKSVDNVCRPTHGGLFDVKQHASG